MSIRLSDLHKSFGSKEVLKGFSLDIDKGQTLSIIGRSGAGKSVTLKHVVGLIRPDSGDVWVDDSAVSRLDQESLYELRRRVGYVFQFAALFDSMTIEENVGMGLRRVGELSEAGIADRVRECLDLVELDGYQDRFPSELSGGQQKRVGIARAIATEPTYLLYDEPTTGLDPITVAQTDELVIRMRQELGVTGVVITHDMESAYRISDRIAMLYDGRVRWEGTPDELKACQDPVVRGFIEGKPELMEETT